MAHLSHPPVYSAVLDGFLTAHRIGIWRCVIAAMAAALLLGQSPWGDSAVSGAMVVAGVAAVALATVGRLWCALYISGRKSGELVDQGPYSVCRHPLYFCNALGLLGLGLLTESLLVTAGLAAVFAVMYPAVMRSEDRLLGARFPGHAAYMRRTPAFWPRPAAYRTDTTWVVHVPAYLRGIGDSVWFLFGGALIEAVDRLHDLRVLSGLVVLP